MGTACGRSSTRGITTLNGVLGLDLETNLLNTSVAGLIQHVHYAFIDRLFIGPDVDPDVVVLIIELLKMRKNLFLRHFVFLEVEIP
jgi:hypothetical protein